MIAWGWLWSLLGCGTSAIKKGKRDGISVPLPPYLNEPNLFAVTITVYIVPVLTPVAPISVNIFSVIVDIFTCRRGCLCGRRKHLCKLPCFRPCRPLDLCEHRGGPYSNRAGPCGCLSCRCGCLSYLYERPYDRFGYRYSACGSLPPRVDS